VKSTGPVPVTVVPGWSTANLPRAVSSVSVADELLTALRRLDDGHRDWRRLPPRRQHVQRGQQGGERDIGGTPGKRSDTESAHAALTVVEEGQSRILPED
jgi:hypothetical protein